MAREGKDPARKSQQPPTGGRDDYATIHGESDAQSNNPQDLAEFLASDQAAGEQAGDGLSEESAEEAREHNEALKAPAFIGKAELPHREQPVQESRDREAAAYMERLIGKRVNTLDFALIPDMEATNAHQGPWIERVVGKNPHPPFDMMTTRIPAKRIPIPPDEVLFYRGGVVRDRQAVHSVTVVMGRERRIFVFDHFYIFEGKEYQRCCWIPDVKWRAGVLFQKMVDKRRRKGVAILKKLYRSSEPAYGIVKGKEFDYRDLKRWFERIWIRGYQIDESLMQDESALLLHGESRDDLAEDIGVGALDFEFA